MFQSYSEGVRSKYWNIFFQLVFISLARIEVETELTDLQALNISTEITANVPVVSVFHQYYLLVGQTNRIEMLASYGISKPNFINKIKNWYKCENDVYSIFDSFI